MTARDVLRGGAPDQAAQAPPGDAAPVGAAQPTAVARPIAPQRPPPAIADERSAAQPGADRDGVRSAVSETGSEAGRSAPITGIRSVAPLTIEVHPPPAAVSGEPALFTVRIGNPNAFDADSVAVTAEFDDAWGDAGSVDRRLEWRLGSLAATSAREIPLWLTPLRAGLLTFRLSAAGAGQPATQATAHVNVQPRLVELDLTGPARRSTGQRAEQLITLVNVAGRALPEAQVDVEYDAAALVVREASAGAVHRSGSIAWPLGVLLQDERVQIQVEFECVGESPQSRVRCRFSSDGRDIVSRAARLDIVPPAVVDVVIADPDDPVPCGGRGRFMIKVRNRGPAPVDDLQLRLTTSPHFDRPELTPATVSLFAEVDDDAYGLDLRAPLLAPGAELTFEATARAALPGDGMLRVLVRTALAPAPFEVEESAVVNPP